MTPADAVAIVERTAPAAVHTNPPLDLAYVEGRELPYWSKLVMFYHLVGRDPKTRRGRR